MSQVEHTKSAAIQLLSRRVSTEKFPRLPENYRPKSIEQALDIQSKMSAINNYAIAGWKCLLPPDSDKVVVAPIYKNTVFSGDEAEFYQDNNAARVEPEIVFVLSKDLPAQSNDFTEQEIDAAIGRTHMALELIQARYQDDAGAEFPELLADGLSNQGLFIGPEIDKTKVYQASTIEITFEQANNKQQLEGSHPNEFPQLPIYWLINYMTKQGITFKAGDAIITGSYAGVVDLAFGETQVNYQGLGQYTVNLKAL